MNSTQSLKFRQYMENQESTLSTIATLVANLNNHLAAAAEHQAYARKDPDGVVDAGLLAMINGGIDPLLAQYAEVHSKALDIMAVKSGEMTADELITKYGINLENYSNNLLPKHARVVTNG